MPKKGMGKSRIEREKKVVAHMIALYCRHRLGTDVLPDEYERLRDYALWRLSRCRFGEGKTVCGKCSVHCYRPDMRQRILEVMRWVGPRMLFYAPLEALRHLWDSRRKHPL